MACKVWGSIWHLINQNTAMLPLLITVMLQETEAGERCVWMAHANGEMRSNKAGPHRPPSRWPCVSVWVYGHSLRGEIWLCFIAQQASPAIIAFPSVLRDISSHPVWICSICSSRPGLVNWSRLQYCPMSPLPMPEMYHNLFFLYIEWKASVEEEVQWRPPDMKGHSLTAL